MIFLSLVLFVMIHDHFITWEQYRSLNQMSNNSISSMNTSYGGIRSTTGDIRRSNSRSSSSSNDMTEYETNFSESWDVAASSLSSSYLGEEKQEESEEEGDGESEEGDGEKDETVVGENDSNMMEWVHVVDDATTTDTSKATASFVESSHKLSIVPVLLITTMTNENTTRNDDDSTTETIATTTNEDGRSNTDFHNLVNNRNDGSNSSHVNTDMDVHYNNDPVMEPILQAGIMYSICGPDRSGNVIADLLYAHAFAYGHNITYGGSCCLRPIYPTNTTRTLLQALQWETLFPFQCPDGVDHVQFRHLRIDSTTQVQSIHPLLLYKDTYRIDGDQSYFTPTWRQHVETMLQNERQRHDNTNRMDSDSDTASSTLTRPNFEIAVHLRRGDVSPCTHARRYLPNSHYLALIDQYTPPLGYDNGRPVHVTIYSESDTFESLDVFAERNYTMEIDTDNLGQVWKALSTADVVILSRSTFSIVPAILNPNIVVATEFMNFNPNHVLDGEFDVQMIDGWEQADPTLVHQSDQIIRDMARTQCS